VSDLTDTSDTFDSAHFRQVLGHFPTGVSVVATVHDGQPAGLAVGSFTSVSLDPPLVLFCVRRESSTWARIEQTGSFCASILAEDQEDVSRVFAGQSDDKFAGLGWRRSEAGNPIVDNALAWIDCTVEQCVDGGDHFIVVGRVKALDVTREGAPLLFFRGGYGRMSG